MNRRDAQLGLDRHGSAKKENKDTIEDKEMAFIVWGGVKGARAAAMEQSKMAKLPFIDHLFILFSDAIKKQI